MAQTNQASLGGDSHRDRGGYCHPNNKIQRPYNSQKCTPAPIVIRVIVGDVALRVGLRLSGSASRRGRRLATSSSLLLLRRRLLLLLFLLVALVVVIILGLLRNPRAQPKPRITTISAGISSGSSSGGAAAAALAAALAAAFSASSFSIFSLRSLKMVISSWLSRKICEPSTLYVCAFSHMCIKSSVRSSIDRYLLAVIRALIFLMSTGRRMTSRRIFATSFGGLGGFLSIAGRPRFFFGFEALAEPSSSISSSSSSSSPPPRRRLEPEKKEIPLLLRERVAVVDVLALPRPSPKDLILLLLRGQPLHLALVLEQPAGQLTLLHQSGHPLRRPRLLPSPVNVHLLEQLKLLLAAGNHLVDGLIVGHLVLVVLLVALVVLQDGLEKGKEFISHLQHLLPLRPRTLLVKHARLNDLLIEVQLVLGRRQNALLHRVHSDQPQHPHLILLPNSMRPILRLQILVRIPVRIKDDDRIGRLQIQPQTSGSSGQQKDKVVRLLGVEHSQQGASIFSFCGSIQSHVLVPPVAKVVLNDGHRVGHLTEEQHPVPGRLKLRQNPIQQLKLARRPVQVRPRHGLLLGMDMLAIRLLNGLKHERVVADLLQLHQTVHQRPRPAPSLLPLLAAVRQQDALRLHVPVEQSLEGGHVALHHVLHLVRQLVLHLLLQPPQQKRSKDLVQSSNNENRLLLIQLHLLAGGGKRGVEPLLKGVAGLEDRREEKVEQRPQLGELVLKGRAREEDSMRCGVVRVENLRQLAVVVLHAVALVDDHVLPLDLRQHRLVLDDVLVGGEEDVELVRLQLRGQVAPGLGRACRGKEGKGLENSQQNKSQHLPLYGILTTDGAHRSNSSIQLLSIGDQGNGLNGLAQAHLIGENAIEVVVVQRDEPLQAEQLVLLQLAVLQQRTLLGDALVDAVGNVVVVDLVGVALVLVVLRRDKFEKLTFAPLSELSFGATLHPGCACSQASSSLASGASCPVIIFPLSVSSTLTRSSC
ncbi:hypothetical protein TYRP_010285 [Tyrophagus putrescentiae]|nr:hypothetical protein TYRP_010285 [Tyrophagus putrescentiae]